MTQTCTQNSINTSDNQQNKCHTNNATAVNRGK